MSQENVEIARAAIHALNHGDLDAAVKDATADFELDLSRGMGPVYRGDNGIEQFFADWLAIWDDYAVDTDEFIDAGDSVVVVVRQRGRGKGSGAHAEQTFFGVYDLEAGKVTAFRMYESREGRSKPWGSRSRNSDSVSASESRSNRGAVRVRPPCRHASVYFKRSRRGHGAPPDPPPVA